MIYGVENYDPFYVYTMLTEDLKIKSKYISVDEVKPKVKVALFFSMKTFRRAFKQLQKDPVPCILFGPQIVYQHLSIEFVEKLTPKKLESLLKQKQELPVLKFSPLNLATTLLDRTKPSIIKDILTLLYKVPDKQQRDKLRVSFFKTLIHAESIDDLSETLISLSYPKKLVKKLMSSVDSKILVKTMKATKLVANKKTTVEKAASKYGIAEFDIRYILSQLEV